MCRVLSVVRKTEMFCKLEAFKMTNQTELSMHKLSSSYHLLSISTEEQGHLQTATSTALIQYSHLNDELST